MGLKAKLSLVYILAIFFISFWSCSLGNYKVELGNVSKVFEQKGIKKEYVQKLKKRGKPEVFSGEELKYIGMPIGGLTTGQVYLGGDGKLWYWDIFNINRIEPTNFGAGDKFY